MADTDKPQPYVPTELDRVVRNRFVEARAAGLCWEDATTFAEGDADVGVLRALVAGDCPAALIADILI